MYKHRCFTGIIYDNGYRTDYYQNSNNNIKNQSIRHAMSLLSGHLWCVFIISLKERK